MELKGLLYEGVHWARLHQDKIRWLTILPRQSFSEFLKKMGQFWYI